LVAVTSGVLDSQQRTDQVKNDSTQTPDFMMKKLIALASLALLLSTPAKSAETCKIHIPSNLNITLSQKQIQADYAGSITYSKIDKSDKNFKAAGDLGKPLCVFDGKIPVASISIFTTREDEVAEAYTYSMRGTEEDVSHLMEMLSSRYKKLSDETRADIKGPFHFGWENFWYDGDIYILLGKHESGYEPIERSLHLYIAKKEIFSKEYSK